MKKILTLILIIPFIYSCTKEITGSSDGELCFSTRNKKLSITNESNKTVNFTVIDESMLPFVLRRPFDCSHFEVLGPGESTEFHLDSLLRGSGKILSIDSWQCERNEITSSRNVRLNTSTENRVCHKPQ